MTQERHVSQHAAILGGHPGRGEVTDSGSHAHCALTGLKTEIGTPWTERAAQTGSRRGIGAGARSLIDGAVNGSVRRVDMSSRASP